MQEAWLHANESSAQIDLRSDSLNPHFAYMEDNGEKHEVWFLDAVTALNEMRAARDLAFGRLRCGVGIGRPLTLENMG